MSDRCLYFAFGSNLLLQQVDERCRDAVLVTTGEVKNHRLDFAGWSSSWMGGVATMTSSYRDDVVGALWSLTPEDIASLDAHEGHPNFYKRRLVDVHVHDDDSAVQAWAYLLDRKLTAPSSEYLCAISEGRRELGLPDADLLDAAVRADSEERARAVTFWKRPPPSRVVTRYERRTSDSPRIDSWAPDVVVRKRRMQ